MKHRELFPDFDEAANAEMDRVYDIKGDTWTEHVMLTTNTSMDDFIKFKMEQAFIDYYTNGTIRALIKLRNYAAMAWTRQQIREGEYGN